jgi:hypothetical protein
MARTDVEKVRVLMNYRDLKTIPISLINVMIDRSHVEVQNLIDEIYENSDDENLVTAETELAVYHVLISIADRQTLLPKGISLGNRKIDPPASSVESLLLMSGIHKSKALNVIKPFMKSYNRILLSVTDTTE